MHKPNIIAPGEGPTTITRRAAEFRPGGGFHDYGLSLVFSKVCGRHSCTYPTTGLAWKARAL